MHIQVYGLYGHGGVYGSFWLKGVNRLVVTRSPLVTCHSSQFASPLLGVLMLHSGAPRKVSTPQTGGGSHSGFDSHMLFAREQ